MGTVKKDITVLQGSKFTFNVAAQNSDGTVMDLTGYSARMQVRESVSSVTTLMEATTANGYITIDTVGGIISVLVPASVTTPMTWQNGVYDLEIFNGSDDVIKVAKGYAALELEVTR